MARSGVVTPIHFPSLLKTASFDMSLKDGGVEKEIPMMWMGPPAISTPPKENLKNEGDPI